MKKIFALLIAALLGATGLFAQDYITTDGKCGKDVAWTFDGKTLTLTNTNTKGFTALMDNYDAQKHPAPWIKKKLKVQAVRVGRGIETIGSCAFAGCRALTEVIFDDNACTKIGWGAFMDCERLVNVALPKSLKSIGTIAFANCRSLTAVKVPDQCHVQDQAFLNCS
ncbi:MAG: leucine-rich repeat domain-containing protein, partial [Alloprevotella sp.]